MKPCLRFFATKSDLETAAPRAEGGEPLYYAGRYLDDEPPVETYATALAIPNIGDAPSDAPGFSPKYIVLPVACALNVQKIRTNSGRLRHLVKWDDNPEGFEVAFGGMYKGEKLVGGDCWPCSESEGAVQRCYEYAERLTEGYIRVRDSRRLAWMVGPEAFSLLKSGFPLQTFLTDWEILTAEAIPKRLRDK